MAVIPLPSIGSGRSDSTLGARNYELISTRPLPRLDIPVTLTRLALGDRANERLVCWYSARRLLLTRISNTARLIGVTSWFIPVHISRALVVPLAFCVLPKLVITLLLLSAPILRMLIRQYEFWFTTILNFLGMVLFAIQIGPDIRLIYPFLTFMSIQVTICSDADVYTLSETARAGVLSSACATALGLFALHQSVYYKTLPPSTGRDWNLAQVNFMANVSMTLAIFIINKSYKRRVVFSENATPYVPLAVVRAKLTVRSQRMTRVPPTRDDTRTDLQIPIAPSLRNLHGPSTTSFVASDLEGPIVSSQTSNGRRRTSPRRISGTSLHFRVVPLLRNVVDAKRTLIPQLCLKRPLRSLWYITLTLCGSVGLSLSLVGVLLIVIFNNHDPSILLPCGVISLVTTAFYCLFHAAHYQLDICYLLLHNFDFWFTMFQFLTATICLADLLDWDCRCLNIVCWAIWFSWSLFTDALLPTYKRKLRFKKLHATPALLAVIFNVIIIAYSLTLDHRGILHSRVIDIGTIRGFFTMVISTGTFMGYRLATIMLWTSRLVWRLGIRPENELVLLRGAVEYRNPFFLQVYSRASLRAKDGSNDS